MAKVIGVILLQIKVRTFFAEGITFLKEQDDCKVEGENIVAI